MTALSDRISRLSPALVFKDVAEGPGFSTTVSCRPGWVHLIQSVDRLRWDKFRAALCPESECLTVQARLGTRALDSSDIRFAQVELERWSGCCPWEVLVASGAPEWLIAPMFAYLGLSDKARWQCSALAPCELQRLAIATALASREVVVCFEGLCEKLSSEWRERVALLLTDSARQSHRIFVLLDKGALTPLWQAPRLIEWFDLDAEDPVNSSVASAEKGLSQAMWSLERLINAGKFAEESAADYVITKPIIIHENSGRSSAEDDVAVESIANPEAAWEELVVAYPQGVSRRPRKYSATWRRSSSLTRVSWWDRLWISSWVRNTRRAIANWLRVMLLGDAPEKGLPANARILHTQRWEWVWEVFVTPIVIILLVFALAQLL